MSLILQGSTSGSVTLQEPAVAGTTVLDLPATSGNVVVDSATQTLTNKTIEGGTVIRGTAVASTSGTSIDFTGIPSWVKRITVMLSGVSTNGTSIVQVQIGAGSVTTSGYSAIAGVVTTAGNAGAPTLTSGFSCGGNISAATTTKGSIIISNITSNTWVAQGLFFNRDDSSTMSCGDIALGGTLDRVRITTVNGTDAFDAGSINILYE